MNKTFARSVLAVAVLASASFAARADDEESSPLSGTAALVSDYVFDGVSQTDNGPALQAGLTYSFDSGLYVGAWASNVDFPDYGNTGIETDWYVGFGWGDESVAFDTGVTVYKYVGLDDKDVSDVAVDYDYSEFYFGATFAENFAVKLFYTPKYANQEDSESGDDVDALRIKFTYSIELNDSWSIPLEFNRWKKDAAYDGDVISDYSHYKVGVATSIGRIGAELSYQKTNLDDDGSSTIEDIYYTSGGFVLALSTEF